jgi:predicted ribonuclease YlaK
MVEGPGAHVDGVPLRERELELQVLDYAIGAMLAGDAGLVLIEGPAGIGKSLIAECAGGRPAEAARFVRA